MARRILVVEDEAPIREMVCFVLEQNGFQPVEAEDYDSAVNQLNEPWPDLILLDWMLPGGSGIQFIKHLKRESMTRDIPVVMLTARGEEEDRVRGLETGADDYITKPFSPSELVARVKAHLRREKRRNSIGNNIIKIGEIEIHKDSYEVYLNKELIDLSTREFQLFLYLCENAGQVLSREQIFNSVWGSDFGDIGTVAVNIKSLRDKIDKENKYIKTIWGVGYKLIKPIGEVI